MGQLKWKKQDHQLLANVRNLKKSKTEWSTQYQEIRDYRKRLLELQDMRCVYCLAPIESLGSGYVELDHILPQKSNGERPDRMVSGLFEDRRVTPGYSHFIFEPSNLVVSCSACNTAKGTFDPCSDRKNGLVSYPNAKTAEKLITWYNPHFHEYAEHIEKTPYWTFEQRSTQGDFTIRACKLHLPDELEKRFQARADVNLSHAPTLRIALYGLASSIHLGRYGLEQAILALIGPCQLTRTEAKQLLDIWIIHVNSPNPEDHARANAALRNVAIIWEGRSGFDEAAEQLKLVAQAVEKREI